MTDPWTGRTEALTGRLTGGGDSVAVTVLEVADGPRPAGAAGPGAGGPGRLGLSRASGPPPSGSAE
jgi:hypothetical protein